MTFLEKIDSPRGQYEDIRETFTSAGVLSEAHNIPNTPGVYILYAKETKFIYPWGESGIFYVGMDRVSINFRILETHKKHTTEAINDERKGNSIYYPVYEYAAAHTGMCMYRECLTSDAASLEGELLARFAIMYGAIPVANKKHDNFWHRLPEIEDY